MGKGCWGPYRVLLRHLSRPDLGRSQPRPQLRILMPQLLSHLGMASARGCLLPQPPQFRLQLLDSSQRRGESIAIGFGLPPLGRLLLAERRLTLLESRKPLLPLRHRPLERRGAATGFLQLAFHAFRTPGVSPTAETAFGPLAAVSWALGSGLRLVGTASARR